VLSQRSRAIWPVPYLFATSLTCAFGAPAPLPTRGFVVDTSDRSEVVSLYHAIYQASEGYQNRIGWTGGYNSIAAGAEGTVSAEFSADVERRLNYLRAMCGVHADVRVNTGATVNIIAGDAFQPAASTPKMAAAQRSALMIIRTYPGNGGLSHSPLQSCVAWTAAAWNANKNGNLALGFFGPGAVDAYAREDVMGTSNWNLDVGHRRWLLFQGATDFATGDTPGSFTPATGSVRPPSNALYVVPKSAELDFSDEPVPASYPGRGYFPAKLNSPYWSLSYPGADFSAATVSMRDSALNPVSAIVVSRKTGYADNTIVWQVPAAAAVKSVSSDTTWHVTVSNIQGDGPSQYTWAVTLIDPDRLNATPSITGPSAPLTSGATYQVAGVAGADEMQAGLFLRKSGSWTEGAEDSPSPKVIDRTSGSYPFRGSNAGYTKSGGKAFRLTFPTRYDPFLNGVPEQSMEIDRELLPGSAGKLNFHFRRGLMTGGSKLAVESSVDAGTTWSVIGTPYQGVGGAGDAGFQAASLTLPPGSGPLRVRFRYYLADPLSPLYSHQDYPAQPTGIFIDDISTTDCTWLEPAATISAPALTSFSFNPATAGTTLSPGQEWWLRARAVLGGKAFPYGPAKVVTPTGPLQLTGPVQPPVSGASYGFIPDPTATGYLLEVARLGAASWLEGAESSPVPQVTDNTASTYALSSNLKGYRKSGALAFRLALSSSTDEEDNFVIERQIVPAATSVLEFWVRRGGMSPTNRLHAEISTDNGATWASAWSLPGLTKAEKAVNKQSVPLAAWADRSIRVRFAVRKTAGGTTLKWNAKTSGVWLDDITVTNAAGLISLRESPVPASAAAIRLDAATAGQALVDGSTVRMRLRPLTGTALGNWGPALVVTPSATSPTMPLGFAGWVASEYPGHDLSFEEDHDRDGLADGIEYAFSLNPTDGVPVPDVLAFPQERMEISRDLAVQREGIRYAAEWTDGLGTWSSAGVEIRFESGKIIASAPLGAKSRFVRWKITEE